MNRRFGRRVGRPKHYLFNSLALNKVKMPKVISGMRRGIKTVTTNSAIKQPRIAKRNGVKSGANQAKNLGVRSGLEN